MRSRISIRRNGLAVILFGHGFRFCFHGGKFQSLLKLKSPTGTIYDYGAIEFSLIDKFGASKK